VEQRCELSQVIEIVSRLESHQFGQCETPPKLVVRHVSPPFPGRLTAQKR
jgi:hypothetical protein